MSKKKATMTLKDFHGGSIPSDLPLPSAPGVIVRNSDRIGLDRPSAWGNHIGRPDHRLRPGSANGVRNFDDKTPFLTHSMRIGRNFDEDDRTPLDGVSAPRRTVSDESIRPEQKVDYAVQSSGRPGSNHGGGSYATRFGGGQVGLAPNAWGLRKDVGVGVQEKVVPVAWSAPDAVAKLAHASALEKVSSGRWHSKQVSGGQAADVEVIRHPEIESESVFQGYGVYGRSGDMDLQVGREGREEASVRKTEKSLSVDDGGGSCVGGKEMQVYERARSPLFSEVQERSHPIYGDGHHSPRYVGKLGGPELQPAESLERPKLKLLPRSKPLENVEPPLVDYKQQQQKLSDPGHVEYVRETHRKGSVYKPGPAGSETGSEVIVRPKLSLKPRSQPPEQMESNVETKRNTLFGGARPRELVLKERGIDDVVMKNHEVGHPSTRTKQDVSRGDTLQVHGTPRFIEKADIGPVDHKSGKYIDRRDHQADVDKSDMQRRNWRSENRRSSRDLEKQSQQVERPPSPETWRKHVEQPAFASGQRYGKAASPLELTNIFSRSISDPKTADRLAGQRGIPSQGQVPFSRLTGPHPRPQINGY